jgi:hypothetical protein
LTELAKMGRLMVAPDVERQVVLWWCQGCKTHHRVIVEGPEGPGSPLWTWNGDLERPTFSPSVLCRHGAGVVCHCFVRDGRIEFLTDSTHEFAGQTVDMEPPPW